MAKRVENLVLDGALNVIHDTSNLMTICSTEPTTRVAAVTTLALADVAMSTADFTVGDGDVSGRKIAIAQKASVTIDTTGTGTHIALVNSTDLLFVTTMTSQAVTTGNTATIGTWDIEIADPT